MDNTEELKLAIEIIGKQQIELHKLKEVKDVFYKAYESSKKKIDALQAKVHELEMRLEPNKNDLP